MVTGRKKKENELYLVYPESFCKSTDTTGSVTSEAGKYRNNDDQQHAAHIYTAYPLLA